MKLYLLFLLAAGITICSPGPGVVMTLTNSMRSGWRGAFGGIVGISVGALVVASISATGIGVVLATSAVAFTVLKFVGAGYLVYLGIRMWGAPVHVFGETPESVTGFGRRFAEGITLQLTNPKAIFFFLSVFPQFMDRAGDATRQFAVLVLSYSALVVVIHSGYALSAQRAGRWLRTERGGRTVNRLGGATLCCFGAALATSRK
jgi:threonine/homoserine/homoserine lactone efflux protein